MVRHIVGLQSWGRISLTLQVGLQVGSPFTTIYHICHTRIIWIYHLNEQWRYKKVTKIPRFGCFHVTMSLCFGKKNLASLVFWSLAWPPRENMPNYKLIFTYHLLACSKSEWNWYVFADSFHSGTALSAPIRTLFQANTIAKWLMHQLKNSSSKNAALPLLSRSSRSPRSVKKRWKTLQNHAKSTTAFDQQIDQGYSRLIKGTLLHPCL